MNNELKLFYQAFDVIAVIMKILLAKSIPQRIELKYSVGVLCINRLRVNIVLGELA